MGIYDGLEKAAAKKSKQDAEAKNEYELKKKLWEELEVKMRPLVEEGLDGFVAMAIKAGITPGKYKKSLLGMRDMIPIQLWSLDINVGILISKDGRFWKKCKDGLGGIYQVKRKDAIKEVATRIRGIIPYNIDSETIKKVNYEQLVKDYFAFQLGLGKIKDSYIE